MIAVESAVLATIEYWSGTLTSTFQSGGVYQYYGVAYSECEGLMAEIDAVIENHGGWPLK
jgi:hypothetical protein